MSFLLFDPLLRPLDTSGAIMPGAYLVFYESETTTPTPVYADADLSTELDPDVDLVADSAGMFPAIYGDTSVVYRRQLYNADDVLQPNGDVDPIHPHVQFPAGTVVFFNGDSTARDIAYPTALWQVCDGSSGTIDFRDRFPIGASGTKVTGATGGSSGTGTLTTSSNGAHDHGTVTGSHTLSTSELPSHTHLIAATSGTSNDTTIDGSTVCDADTPYGGDSQYRLRQRAGSANAGLTSGTGSGSGHTHSISSDGAHTHTVSVSATVPAWGALWILQRKA